LIRLSESAGDVIKTRSNCISELEAQKLIVEIAGEK